MLTREMNELLARVGRDTPMGAMLRQYWTPVMRSERLEPGGAPVRVRLLGENFVAFRSPEGEIGFLDEACPHRCASLAMARNEEGGLRCIFHGWKISPCGKVVDIPNEPPERSAALAEKVRVNHYPVREAGGLVWVLPNRSGQVPKFPDFEFTRLPKEHIHVRVALLPFNWYQTLESILDTGHIGFLHRSSVQRANNQTARNNTDLWLKFPYPTLEHEITPYGLREAALRKLPDGRLNTRVREFVAPYHTFLPAELGVERQLVITIPIDDLNCAQIIVLYNPLRPITQEEIEAFWFDTHPDPDNIAAHLPGASSLWGQDREAMKQGHYSGLVNRHVFYEDFAVLDSMGPIADRSNEHLTQADATLIIIRQQFLKSLRAFQDGKAPWGLENPEQIDYGRIRTISTTVAPERNWRELDAYAV